jgi:hypothetical protein
MVTSASRSKTAERKPQASMTFTVQRADSGEDALTVPDEISRPIVLPR